MLQDFLQYNFKGRDEETAEERNFAHFHVTLVNSFSLVCMRCWNCKKFSNEMISTAGCTARKGRNSWTAASFSLIYKSRTHCSSKSELLRRGVLTGLLQRLRYNQLFIYPLFAEIRDAGNELNARYCTNAPDAFRSASWGRQHHHWLCTAFWRLVEEGTSRRSVMLNVQK